MDKLYFGFVPAAMLHQPVFMAVSVFMLLAGSEKCRQRMRTRTRDWDKATGNK